VSATAAVIIVIIIIHEFRGDTSLKQNFKAAGTAWQKLQVGLSITKHVVSEVREKQNV